MIALMKPFIRSQHRCPKLTIRVIDQILMIYARVSSDTWPPKVRGVVLHFGPLKI